MLDCLTHHVNNAGEPPWPDPAIPAAHLELGHGPRQVGFAQRGQGAQTPRQGGAQAQGWPMAGLGSMVAGLGALGNIKDDQGGMSGGTNGGIRVG